MSVKPDTNPAVKERGGEVQAFEAAELEQGPQLCCSHREARYGDFLLLGGTR